MSEKLRQAAQALLDAALEYEFIGTLDGTYGGRWTLTVEDKAAVWPAGTAVYVRRSKE
jgi:hypothetical protein